MLLCYKGAIPTNLLNNFNINSELHTYNTRQSSNFHIPLIRTKVSQNTLIYKGPIIWNGLPSHVKLSPTLNTFKRRYKHVRFNQSS